MSPPDKSDKRTGQTQIRTRQGCLTCRKRRRKCDEQKPRCQNCTGRNLICRYGVKLTFLSTNIFNLVPEDAQALRETTPSTYRHIRFVDGLDETERITGDDVERHDDVPPFEPSEHTALGTPDADDSRMNHSVPDSISSVPSQPQSQFQDPYNYDDNNETIEPRHMGESSNNGEQHHQAPVVYPSVLNHSPQIPAGDAKGADYDRLVLERLSSQGSLRAVSMSPGRRAGTAYSKHWLPPLGTVSKTFKSTVYEEDLSQQQPPSNDRRNALLKFFIDEVAPWLDICTPQSSYGIHIPILAREYTPLLHAVLALAVQQQSLFLPSDSAKASQSAELVRMALVSIRSDMYSSRDAAIAACALLMIRELFSTQIQDWKRVLKDRIDFLGLIGVDGFSEGYRGSASWVTLRLDLAYTIFSGTPPMTPVEKWHYAAMPFSDDPNIMSMEHSKSPEWTRRAILLCSQAAQLHFSAEISNITTSHSVADTWTYLWRSTRSWFERLPSSMHPIFTSPISAIDLASPYFFPLILYTSRSNMYAAIMHHTTSIFLLQSKQPTVRPSPHLKTPTWHAVQICGICIANNTHWSHDPTILAALIYAGRFISYQEQKKELLETLQALVKASGWQVVGAIDEMIEWWRVDSGL